jgi:16S rRNA U516 pseudouridylate synthase RsuA-like enzyme
MLAAVGCSVLRLVRVRVGSLTLSGVASGAWRYLTEKEVARLLH